MNALNLIIGGTTKSGTTSLFQYLGDHPEVCSSSMKETRFFLDKEYPLESKYRYEDGIDKYHEFFKQQHSKKILMEATPDYLYSKNTARKIKESLPNVKMIFILRDPKARFVSWFNFSKQIGKLGSDATLEQYIEMQLMDEDPQHEQYLLALQQGNYSNYLKDYYQTFTREDIHTCFFEDLVQSPLPFMEEIAKFLGIEAEFYKTYNFQKHNATVNIKNQGIHKKYISLSFRLRKFTHDKKIIHSSLKRIKKIIHPIYASFNTKTSTRNGESEKGLESLNKYYVNETIYYQAKYENLDLHKVKN